jgi:hypothetical protein
VLFSFTGQVHLKLIRNQLWCTRQAFRQIKFLQWCSGQRSWKSVKKSEKNK